MGERQPRGFDAQRGDAVSVVNAPFARDVAAQGEEDNVPLWEHPRAMEFLRIVVGGLAVLALILFVLRPMLAQVDWRRQIRVRQAAYRQLAARLRGVPGVTIAVPVAPPGSVPQAMPLWVPDPDYTVRALRGCGIEAMRWPGREQVPFSRDRCPGTLAWIDRSVLLPLGYALTPRHLEAMACAVKAAIGTAPAHRASIRRSSRPVVHEAPGT